MSEKNGQPSKPPETIRETDWKWLGSRWFRGVAVGVLILMILLPVARLSWLKWATVPSLETFVYADEVAKPGGTAAVRVFAREGEFDLPVEDARVSLKLREKRCLKVSNEFQLPEEGMHGVTFEVPEILESNLDLRAKVRSSLGRARLDTLLQIGEFDAAPAAPSLISEEPLIAGLVRLELVPENGTLVRNVENRVFLRTTNPEDEPLSTIGFTGAGTRFETNELGLGSFSLIPEDKEEPITLSARLPDGSETRVRQTHRASEAPNSVLLRLARRSVSAGEELEIEVLSAVRQRPVFLDLMDSNGSLLSGHLVTEAGKGSLTWTLPEELKAERLTLRAFVILSNGTLAQTQARLQVVSEANGETLPPIQLARESGAAPMPSILSSPSWTELRKKRALQLENYQHGIWYHLALLPAVGFAFGVLLLTIYVLGWERSRRIGSNGPQIEALRVVLHRIGRSAITGSLVISGLFSLGWIVGPGTARLLVLPGALLVLAAMMTIQIRELRLLDLPKKDLPAFRRISPWLALIPWWVLVGVTFLALAGNSPDAVMPRWLTVALQFDVAGSVGLAGVLMQALGKHLASEATQALDTMDLRPNVLRLLGAHLLLALFPLLFVAG